MPKTIYPRPTLKKIIKAHANRGLSRDVDILIFLNYALFLRGLVNEAAIKSKIDGEKGVSARSVRRVSEGCLRGWKG